MESVTSIQISVRQVVSSLRAMDAIRVCVRRMVDATKLNVLLLSVMMTVRAAPIVRLTNTATLNWMVAVLGGVPAPAPSDPKYVPPAALAPVDATGHLDSIHVNWPVAGSMSCTLAAVPIPIKTKGSSAVE